MKKALVISILTLCLIATAGLVFGAEMAKEGSDTLSISFIAKPQVFAVGKEYLQMNYDTHGVVRTENKSSPFYMSSIQCVGSIKSIKGEFKESGLCTYTRPNGGQIYVSYEGTGILGKSRKGRSTFVGGTEKCVGITGGGEWSGISLRAPAKGVSASILNFTYNWKVP